jgi:hypothetical protein
MKIGELQDTYIVEPVEDPVPVVVGDDAEETPTERQEEPREEPLASA